MNTTADARDQKIQSLTNEVEALRQRVQQLEALEVLQEKAEEELLKFNSELTAVYLALPDTILRVDDQGLITDCKTNAQHTWGELSADENPPPWYHDRFAERIRAEIGTVRENGQQTIFQYEMKGIPDPCWYEVQAYTFLHNQVILVLRDITVQKQAEEHSVLLKQERKITEVLQNFINVIAHDFKTPLSIIQTSADLIVRIPDHQRQLDHTSKITSQVARLSRMIDNILIMSRLETASELQMVLGSVNSITNHIQLRYQQLAAARNLHFVYAPAHTLDAVLINRNELLVAIEKLLENALLYTPAGGEIRLSTYREGNDIVVEICDTGVGISREDLPYIFERFFRADRARSMSTGENGLGLTIAQRVVTLHSGTIRVKSTEGSGSCFAIHLPIRSQST